MQMRLGLYAIALLSAARAGCGYLQEVCQQGECKELPHGCQHTDTYVVSWACIQNTFTAATYYCISVRSYNKHPIAMILATLRDSTDNSIVLSMVIRFYSTPRSNQRWWRGTMDSGRIWTYSHDCTTKHFLDNSVGWGVIWISTNKVTWGLMLFSSSHLLDTLAWGITCGTMMPCSSTSYVVNIETSPLNLLLWYFGILTNTVNTSEFTAD